MNHCGFLKQILQKDVQMIFTGSDIITTLSLCIAISFYLKLEKTLILLSLIFWLQQNQRSGQKRIIQEVGVQEVWGEGDPNNVYTCE
jgi:hypothetical protein